MYIGECRVRSTKLDMHLPYVAVAVRCEQPTAGYNMQPNKQGTVRQVAAISQEYKRGFYARKRG